MVTIDNTNSFRETNKFPRLGSISAFPKWASIATAMIGVIVLAGWIFSIPLLKSMLPGAVQMKANTAIGLLLAATSLFFLSNQPSPLQKRLSQFFAFTIIALGLATVFQYLFNWSLGIDELLFQDTAHAFNAIPGRMSPITALIFTMLGIALIALPSRMYRSLVLMIAAAIVILNTMICIGYLWSANELVTDSWLPPVAIHTSVAFILLGVGVIYASWNLERAQIIYIRATKKILAGFGIAFVLLIVLGNFAYRASTGYERSAESLSTHFGLFVILICAVAIFVTLFIEIQQEMASNQRTQVQLQETATRIATILNTVTDGIITFNHHGNIDSFNYAAERLFGYKSDEIIGNNIRILISEPYHHLVNTLISHYLTPEKGDISIGQEVIALRKDGSKFEMSLSVNEMWLTGQQYFTGVMSDITERKKIEHCLIESKEQAELANRAKDTFLATKNHEIRTPLTGLLGMMELLSLSPLNNEQNTTLNSALNSAKGLLRIVNDILDWSKIEEGKLQLSLNATAIPQLLQDVVNTYLSIANAKNLVLFQNADPKLSTFHMVDSLRLSQVLNNFISNAIKFTENGTIELRATLLEKVNGSERVRFSVSDTGIGITEEVQKKLFLRHPQAEVDTARLYGGTGLGLSICRRLAELMDGWVELESQAGQGSTFHITLTLPVCDEPTPNSNTNQGQRMTNQASKNNSFSIKFLPDANGALPIILAVDDHPINRNLLATQLKVLGLRSETADNGLSALEKWQSGPFSLIITDCHMPQMDGYTLSQEIRKMETEQNRAPIPIIAWTANALAEEVKLCHDAGMNELLVKPTNLEQLTLVLTKYLQHE